MDDIRRTATRHPRASNSASLPRVAASHLRPAAARSSISRGHLTLAAILLAALLIAAPCPTMASERSLPPGKRVSFEKVQLAEDYRMAVEKCRKEQRSTLREKCIARKKIELNEKMEMLDSDPRLYFEKKNRPEEEGRKAGRKGAVE